MFDAPCSTLLLLLFNATIAPLVRHCYSFCSTLLLLVQHRCCSLFDIATFFSRHFYYYWVPMTFGHNPPVPSLPLPSPCPAHPSQTDRLSELIYMIPCSILLMLLTQHCYCPCLTLLSLLDTIVPLA